MDKPIIILGSERSGTNLLRHLLANHSNISGPVSPQFFEVFFPVTFYYGNLRVADNLELLFKHMVRLANHPYHNWNLHIKFSEFYRKYKPKSIIELFNCLYIVKAENEGKSRYVSKDIHAWFQAHKIKSTYPKVRFIYLVRDPRDHVRSWMKRPINLLTPLDAIKKWKKDQSEILNLYYGEGIEWYLLRYEDLITDTEKTMSGLLKYLEEDIQESCFETKPENAEESRWNDYWKNLGKKIKKDNKGKFRDKLDIHDIELIETYCASEMRRFGYKPVTSQNWQPSYRYKIGLIRKKNVALRKKYAASKQWKKNFSDRQLVIMSIRKSAHQRWLDSNNHIGTKVNPIVNFHNMLNFVWRIGVYKKKDCKR